MPEKPRSLALPPFVPFSAVIPDKLTGNAALDRQLVKLTQTSGPEEALNRSASRALTASLIALLDGPNLALRPWTPAWYPNGSGAPLPRGAVPRLKREREQFDLQVAMIYRLACALARRQAPEGDAYLLQIFRTHREAWVRRRLAEAALGLPHSRGPVPGSARLLAGLGAEVARQKPDELTRTYCAQALFLAEPIRAFDKLAPLLRKAEPDDMLGGGVCAGLSRDSDPRWLALARKLGTDPERRWLAFGMLCAMWGAPGVEEALAALLRADYADRPQLGYASSRLKELRSPSAASLLLLVLELGGPDRLVVYDLAEVGDPAVLPTLRKLLEGSSGELREALEYTISKLSSSKGRR